MNQFRFSSPAERVSAAVISAVCVACMAILVFLLKGDLFSFIICMLASVLVTAGLGFYVLNLFKAACIPHADTMTLEVKGILDFTVQLSDAICLETAGMKTGPIVTRSLIFTDETGQTVASVPTFFTANQGAQAEPLAIELAKALGISIEP